MGLSRSLTGEPWFILTSHTTPRLWGKSSRFYSDDETQVPSDLWRTFQLLTVFERIVTPSVAGQFRPGYFSYRRAAVLLQLEQLDLALVEIEEARRLAQGHPNDDFLLLEILRKANLPKAVQTAHELASDPDLDARVLAECVHVLATSADQLADEPFQAMAARILELADRFERAPGRDRVHASTLAIVQFNRGLVQLRLGQLHEAQLRWRWRGPAIPPSPSCIGRGA